MKYLSTRGQSPALGFSDILLGGLAPDGGLYMPAVYPHFGATELAALRGMNYRELAFAIFSRLADDIPAADLKVLLDKTYTAEVYGHGAREERKRIERHKHPRNIRVYWKVFPDCCFVIQLCYTYPEMPAGRTKCG